MEWRKTSPTSSVTPADIAAEALQTSDRTEEADVWLMEEGDDSVFYSDEDQTDQDRNPHTSCEFGARKSRCPVKERIPGPGAEAMWGNVGMQNEASLHFVLAKWETASVSEAAESLQLKSRNPDVQQQPKLNITSDTAHLLIKVGEEEKYQQQMPGAELWASGNRQHLDQHREAVQDYSSQALVGCLHDHSPGRSTLPLVKTPGQNARHHKSFDHLTSSKYSTVSYRRIRRGNTRQKIKEFEYMMINM